MPRCLTSRSSISRTTMGSIGWDRNSRTPLRIACISRSGLGS